MNFNEQLIWYANRAVPIVLIDQAVDEIATVKTIVETFHDSEEEYPCIYVWDFANGIRTAQCRQFESAEAYLKTAVESKNSTGDTRNPVSALLTINQVVNASEADKSKFACAFIFYMGDRLFSSSQSDMIVQCLLNLRDQLVYSNSTIILVGIDFKIPAELDQQIALLHAPLPTETEYGGMIDSMVEAYETRYEEQLKNNPDLLTDVPKYELTGEVKEQMIESLKGTSEFCASQNLALSTTMTGIDSSKLRTRAIQAINSTRGLSVAIGDGKGFAGLGGLQSIKEYCRRLIAGNMKLKIICFLDEVEKALAGAIGGDTSGVSGNLLGALLSAMQDTNSLGMIYTGVPGAGKSAYAMRFGEEANVLTARFDLSGMKESLVGSSEANLRAALRTIREIGDDNGGILYIATCNRPASLPPEFKRRFNLGTFFFDFPDPDEKATIWQIYLNKFGLTDEKFFPDDAKWTGAEIESCCRIAHLMDCSVIEAAERIVPVSQTAKDDIAALQQAAHKTFLSTSYPGTYDRNRQLQVNTKTKERKLKI